MSVEVRDHNTALTRELNPNKLFSKPDSLEWIEIVIKKIYVDFSKELSKNYCGW